MSSKPYPLPQSLKDDWRGWVVDQDIRVIEDTDNITFIEPRKIPEGYHVFNNNRYGQANTSVIEPPSGINTNGSSKGASIGEGNNYKYSDNVKNIQDSCVAPGTINSLFSIPEKSCSISERWSGYRGAWESSWGSNSNNHFTSYAGINAGENGTTPNLTNELSEIDTFDVNNIKFITWDSDISYNPDNESFTFPTKGSADNPPSETHTYIDVEKKPSDWNIGDDVYWNDYDIWDIKRLYKQNYNDSSDDQRKIWWNNLYNPYCHDMYEWIDTGLRSNESTMKMTCSYKENSLHHGSNAWYDRWGIHDTIYNKEYVSDVVSSLNGGLGYWHTRGPHEDHPLNSILNNSYQIQNENGEMVNCENCKNKAAVSWDKEDNGIITGFTETLEDSTYTETELRTAFAFPSDRFYTNAQQNKYFGDKEHAATTTQQAHINAVARISLPSDPNAKHQGFAKLIPEIIGATKSGGGNSYGGGVPNNISTLREPVVVNITTAQAMRFCNENDDCAGFLHYRLPDNFDYIRNGHSNCEDVPDYIGEGCFSTPPPWDILRNRISGTLTSNSYTPLDRIKNLFVFKKIIGSDDPDDENWGPNIEADELIRPNKYVYCKNGTMDSSIPEEYQNFKTDGLFESSDNLILPTNKCAPFKSSTQLPTDFQFNKNAIPGFPPARDSGINGDGICVGRTRNDGVNDSNRTNSYLLERCRDNNLSPLVNKISGDSSAELDDLLYRNLPAYVYKKKPRPDYTRETYKTTSGQIHNELSAQTEAEINTIVDSITDLNQITGNYEVIRNINGQNVSVAFDCANIADNYITKNRGILSDEDRARDNCTEECIQDIEMKALYKIHCELPGHDSSSCQCLSSAMTNYTDKRNSCVHDRAIHKEYIINMKEKRNIDTAVEEYYTDSHAAECADSSSCWFTDTTDNTIRPSRHSHHPSSKYIESLATGHSNRDYTNLASGANKLLWQVNEGESGSLFIENNEYLDPQVPEINCCINDIDLTAGPTGHVEVSDVRQCIQCGDIESPACSEHVTPGGLFSDPSIQIPGTSPPPGPLDDFFGFFSPSETNINQETNEYNSVENNSNEEENWFDSFINFLTELLN